MVLAFWLPASRKVTHESILLLDTHRCASNGPEEDQGKSQVMSSIRLIPKWNEFIRLVNEAIQKSKVRHVFLEH